MTEGNRWEAPRGASLPQPAPPCTIQHAAAWHEPAAQPAPEGPPRRYRSLWISDVHLGTRGCRASLLLDFLRHTDSERLYLVGDIVDAWQLRKGWYWPERHNEVVRALLRKARGGTLVVYVPGNHDEFLRQYGRLALGGVSVVEDAVHTMADGRRFLVIHGDAFDGVVTCARWLAHLGDRAYHTALHLNRLLNAVRRRLGYPYWSLSSYLKHRVKNAVSFISNFEGALVEVARQRGLDGVICGHIHHPELRVVEGLVYANDGDWVESCTALAEHGDGTLELIHWARERQIDFHELTE